MTERKKGKKKKGQAVVSLLRMVLLLGCCRGGTSEHVEDRDKILHDRYRTRTLKIKKKPKKSLFSGALGLFRKSGAEKSGRDNDTDMQFQLRCTRFLDRPTISTARPDCWSHLKDVCMT
ncbi:hypothetical protein SRHO_G00335500 [Serrasalmus rhombeus]